MEKTETVLVPFDFGQASEEALRVAQDLAARYGARVVLAHVDEVPFIASPEMAPIMIPMNEIADASRRALEEVAAKNGNLEIILRFGDPAAVILALIEETKPRLVCMGTHGRRGFTRLVLGSVAEQVVRASVAPVVTVHAPMEKAA